MDTIEIIQELINNTEQALKYETANKKTSYNC